MPLDRTFWVESEQAGRPVLMAVTSDDPLQEVFADTGVLGVPVREYLPCKECPAVATCMESVWGDGRRMGGPSLVATQLTEVYPCRTCGEMAFQPQVYGSFHRVSEDCPRGDTTHSALDCRACSDLKDILARTPPDKTSDPVAARLLTVLLHDWPTRFPKVWDRLSPDDLREWQGAWEGCLRRGLREHPTQPDKILLEVLLDMTERPGLADLWAVMGVKERKFLWRVWEGLIRRVLRDVA